MNSKSDGYYDAASQKENCPTILECGSPSGVRTVLTTFPTTPATPPTVIATVPANISKCCDACNLIEYVSTITITASFISTVPLIVLFFPATATFNVTIFKNCTNGLRVPVGSYTFNQTFIFQTATFALSGAGSTTSAFSFFVCDCDTCSDECCYYSAEITSSTVTPPFVIPGLVTITTTATVNNPTLAAIVGSSSCSC